MSSFDNYTLWDSPIRKDFARFLHLRAIPLCLWAKFEPYGEMSSCKSSAPLCRGYQLTRSRKRKKRFLIPHPSKTTSPSLLSPYNPVIHQMPVLLEHLLMGREHLEDLLRYVLRWEEISQRLLIIIKGWKLLNLYITEPRMMECCLPFPFCPHLLESIEGPNRMPFPLSCWSIYSQFNRIEDAVTFQNPVNFVHGWRKVREGKDRFEQTIIH